MPAVNRPPAPRVLGCSITSFNNAFIDLIEQDNAPVADYYRACILGLSGKDITRNIQYSIEPTRNRFQAPREVTVVRDYDSFLSFTDWLPVKADMFLYPINNPVDTLHSSLHFKVPMSIKARQPDTPVSPHRVPNICLGAIGIHTKVRLFFPRLYDSNTKDPELTFDQKKGLYEKGLMPVLQALSPDTVTNWSVNYEGAQTRARKARGLFQYGTRPFSGSHVRRLGYDLAERLGMLFMVQMQGVKEAHQHHPDDLDSADLALQNALSDFYYDELMEEEHCYVDVGLELSEPGYAYQWRTDAHAELLSGVTDIPAPRARALVKAREAAVDYSSGLIQLSGCRVPIPLQTSNIVYFQAYTTDKALIQQNNGGRHSLFITGKAALEEEEPAYLTRLTNTTALQGWRQWRLVRLTAIIRTLRLQNQGPAELRFTSPALSLMAGLTWLANGLHSRPDDGHIQNNDGLPFCAHGAYFLRDMMFPPISTVPRMLRTNVISQTSFIFFFGADQNTLRNRYHPTAYIPRSAIPKSWVSTQKSMLKRHRADNPEPSAAFATLEYEAPPPPQDTGDDLPFDERLDLPPGLDEPFPITITKHWNQFCCDLLQKCGNMKGNPIMQERLVVMEDMYKETNLALIFHHVQWKRAHPVEWREAFDKFFPPPGTAPRLQPQNYPNMSYWMEWADMKRDKPAYLIDEIRTKYWGLFKQLYWIPKPYNNRLWKYSEDSGFVTLPSTYKLSAPHVIIHPSKAAPTWQPTVDDELALEEEEDDEEDEIQDPDYVPAAEWIDNVPPIPMCIYMRQEEEESSDSD
ncbi:hypothetical protein BDR07DRAFT_1381622 [Suillus spraguei]|nr:hypothetical protein BDR07DRAFT_1381622 [Suillus spraguei]